MKIRRLSAEGSRLVRELRAEFAQLKPPPGVTLHPTYVAALKREYQERLDGIMHVFVEEIGP